MLNVESVSQSREERAGKTNPQRPSSQVESTRIPKHLKPVLRRRLIPTECRVRPQADGGGSAEISDSPASDSTARLP